MRESFIHLFAALITQLYNKNYTTPHVDRPNPSEIIQPKMLNELNKKHTIRSYPEILQPKVLNELNKKRIPTPPSSSREWGHIYCPL